MGTKGIHLLTVLLIIGLVLAVVGCATPAATPTTSSTSAVTKILKIGMSAPMTGPTASWGQEYKKAHEIMFDKVNADGGLKIGDDVCKLELIVYDHKGQATEGVANTNRLIFQDGVKHISLHSSAPTLASVPITSQNKVISVASGYAKFIGPEYPYSFRGEYTGTEAGEGLYGYIATNMKDIKTVAGISNDDDRGKAGLKASLANANKFGITTLTEQYVPNGTQDFYPAIAKMLAGNPDLIDLDAMAPADKALFIKQVREKGYKGPMLGTDQTDLTLLVDVAGKENSEGFMQEGLDFSSDIATPEQKWFYDVYIKNYGPPFEANCGKYANMAVFWIDGFTAAKTTDPVKMTELMPDSTLDVLGVKMEFGGLQRYGVKHQVNNPVYVSQVQDGKLITLGKFFPEVP